MSTDNPREDQIYFPDVKDSEFDFGSHSPKVLQLVAAIAAEAENLPPPLRERVANAAREIVRAVTIRELTLR